MGNHGLGILRMNRWTVAYRNLLFDTHSIAERKIQEAMADGAFDNLPGKGLPLDLDPDAGTPPELRAAHRILKNANVVPDWIQLDKDLRASIAECRGMRIELEMDCRKLGHREKQMAVQRYVTAMKSVNDDILKYNLLSPTCTQRHLPFRIEEEKARLRETAFERDGRPQTSDE